MAELRVDALGQWDRPIERSRVHDHPGIKGRRLRGSSPDVGSADIL
jgi:hypothetical protein